MHPTADKLCWRFFSKVIICVQVVFMAMPGGRPASDCYQPAACVAEPVEDEDDGTRIFSLSKSSMDVVMAAGPPHKRDPVWTPVDLRRSSSTHTHSDTATATAALKQRHPHIWQHMSEVGVHKADVHSPPTLSHTQQPQQQRWSQCSSGGGGGNTHSRSSTPDTVVWRDDLSRPSSLTLETLYPAAPDSPQYKPPSPPAEASLPLSPQLLSPDLPPEDLPPEDLLTFTSSPLRRGPHQPRVSSSAASSPLSSPQRASVSSPLMSSTPNLLQLPDTEDEDLQENNHLSFTFSSPALSSASLAEGGGDSGCLSQVIRELQLSENECARSPVPVSNSRGPGSPAEEPESAVCLLELPWQPEPSCLTSRSWRSPLVASMSDSHLVDCCRCCCNSRNVRRPHRAQMFKEEGTMTIRPEMVDMAVQTLSPIGSLWGLKRNISNSNMGSHSLLGSPPGSKLNLKSSVGSNSNLVSPTSSMFPGSSGGEEEEEELEKEDEEEEEKLPNEQTEQNSAHQERRRSCLKIQGEEKDEYARRSSMKQVQWDEDGMTWDVHGASPEPEVLESAIQRHLEVQSSPRLDESASKKKKRAPLPPVLSGVVKPGAPEPPTAGGAAEGADGGGPPDETDGGCSGTETPEAARRISRAEAEAAAAEDDEVYGEEGSSSSPRPPSRASALVRKKSVIRLRRPGWCGSSRKTT